MNYNFKCVQTKSSNLIKGFKIIIMKIRKKGTFVDRCLLLFQFTGNYKHVEQLFKFLAGDFLCSHVNKPQSHK